MKKYIKCVYETIRSKIVFLKKFKKATGIGVNGYVDLRYNYSQGGAKLFGKKIRITDSFWHLHSLHEIFVDSIYEFPSKKDNPIIIDCGANVGLSVIFFKRLFPQAQIWAYEADPHIFELLQSNLAEFNFNDVVLENKAVWIDNGIMDFDASGALGGSLMNTENEKESKNKIAVPTFRLKDLLTSFMDKGEEIDLLKIDIEGAELSVLEDCSATLSGIKNIFVEYHRKDTGDTQVGQFLSILEKAGFHLYIKEAWNNLPHPFKFRDYSPKFDLQLNIFAYKK